MILVLLNRYMFKYINYVGNDITTMYQLIGIITNEKVPGLESILNYMNEDFVSKDDPAIHEHHFHITKHNTTKKHIPYTI